MMAGLLEIVICQRKHRQEFHIDKDNLKIMNLKRDRDPSLLWKVRKQDVDHALASID